MTRPADPIASALSLKSRLEVSAASRCGLSHARNEDSLLAFPEAGLFCVADGLGGHIDGQLASRAITSILERVVDPGTPLAERVADTREALLSINAALIREAERVSVNGVIGSTVVALILDHAHGTCLWAGDSRCYLARDGRLFQLTRDHALAREDAGRSSAVLTRAIGSARDLEIDRIAFEIAPGDVVLLCSDGVTAGLSPAAIHAFLDAGTLDADALVDAAVAGGSRDDVTAIIARIGPIGPA